MKHLIAVSCLLAAVAAHSQCTIPKNLLTHPKGAPHGMRPKRLPDACLDLSLPMRPAAVDAPIEPIVLPPLLRYQIIEIAGPETYTAVPCTYTDTGGGSWWGNGVTGSLRPHIGIPGQHVAAPEIDPASVPAALTLLFGSLAVIRSRR